MLKVRSGGGYLRPEIFATEPKITIRARLKHPLSILYPRNGMVSKWTYAGRPLQNLNMVRTSKKLY
jgi:hypothetical protein